MIHKKFFIVWFVCLSFLGAGLCLVSGLDVCKVVQ